MEWVPRRTQSRAGYSQTRSRPSSEFPSERLEHIPLALLQVASFIQREKHEPTDLNDDQLAIHLRQPLSSSEPVSAAAIWISTFERILGSNSDTIDLLSILTLLGGARVLFDFVKSICGFWSKLAWINAYGSLIRHHFMVEKTTPARLTIRPLLNIVSRDWLMETGRARRTLERIINSVPAMDVDGTLTILDAIALTSAMKPVLVGMNGKSS